MSRIFYLKIYLVILSFCNCISYTYAQDNIKVFSSKIKNEQNLLSMIPDTDKSKDVRNFTFYGFGQRPEENVITTGFNLLSLEKKDIAIDNLEQLVLEYNLPAYFYINLFSKNVDTLYVDIRFGNNIEKTFKLKVTEKYRPIEVLIWNDDDIMNISNPQITSLRIYVKDTTNRPFDLVVGECKIYQRENQFKTAQAQFFSEYTIDEKYKPDAYIKENIGNSLPIKNASSFKNFGYSNFDVEYDKDINQTEKDSLFFALVEHVFKRYPFYKEHQLDSIQMQKELVEIEKSPVDFNTKLSTLYSLINSFNDCHFRLIYSEQEKCKSPIYAYEKNGELYIAAIFSDTLNTMLHRDMKIKSVNNIQINQYVDSLAMHEYGNNEQRKASAISHLFALKTTDNLLVEVMDSTNTTSKVIVEGSYKIKIPNNFRPKHYDFKVLPNEWGYVKLNSWSSGDWISFLNIISEFEELKGIIFDLRGNPGGELYEALRITSCFINQPIDYSYLSYNGIKLSPEELLPNQFYKLNNLGIQILIDNKTACTSEMFAYLMRKYVPNTTIIGATHSVGTYSSLSNFIFPNDITLATNVLEKPSLVGDGQALEYVGIKPDIVVTINSHLDLYGYNDKVLQVAVVESKNNK